MAAAVEEINVAALAQSSAICANDSAVPAGQFFAFIDDFIPGMTGATMGNRADDEDKMIGLNFMPASQAPARLK